MPAGRFTASRAASIHDLRGFDEGIILEQIEKWGKQGELQHVTSWYGLPAEITVENNLWHLVRVAGVPLHHPPVVNLILRRGLPEEARLRLSFLHEFGHLQTLPLAIAHVLILLIIGRWRRRGFLGSLAALMTAALAHEAVWELASEAYAVTKAGQDYRRIYRRHPNPGGQVLFWGSMIGIAIFATLKLLRR
jgi:hypothetical protein